MEKIRGTVDRKQKATRQEKDKIGSHKSFFLSCEKKMRKRQKLV